MYNPFTLEGKTILVTGASGGIGRATAVECSKLGAKVILSGRNGSALEETLAAMDGTGHIVLTADLTVEDDVRALVEQCPELDGFVSNAGVMKLTPIQFITDRELHRIQDINLNAPIMLTKTLLNKKKIRKGGSIVFTASAAGVFRVSVGNAIYASTKSGLDAFMRTVALELGTKGIRCNCVNPGMVETALIDGFTEEERMREVRNYPLRRFARPQDVALGIAYLLSDASSFVTGTALKIDGGMTLS
jgi:NAD(P)-dependent dehydrogenase (short-subunit alcohol dehydrogenase family)